RHTRLVSDWSSDVCSSDLLVAGHLRPEPTLLALLSDRYTSESSLRPFAPLADKLGSRMHVLVLAEWPQPERERDGEALLRTLGRSEERRVGKEGGSRWSR